MTKTEAIIRNTTDDMVQVVLKVDTVIVRKKRRPRIHRWTANRLQETPPGSKIIHPPRNLTTINGPVVTDPVDTENEANPQATVTGLHQAPVKTENIASIATVHTSPVGRNIPRKVIHPPRPARPTHHLPPPHLQRLVLILGRKIVVNVALEPLKWTHSVVIRQNGSLSSFTSRRWSRHIDETHEKNATD